MWMHAQGGVEGEARFDRRASAEQDLGEVQHCGKVPGLELERVADVVEALLVASQQVIQRRALVPCLREIGRPAQELREARFGDVVAARRDVAGGEIERPCGRSMRM